MTFTTFFENVPSYSEQRYERLKESIDEYLGEQGEDSGSAAFLRDIQKACVELKHFHEVCLDSFNHVHDFFL